MALATVQGKYLLIDITDLVKQWLGDETGQNALPNYGFALVPHPIDPDTPEVANINFDSKENPQTSHDALLNVQLEVERVLEIELASRLIHSPHLNCVHADLFRNQLSASQGVHQEELAQSLAVIADPQRADRDEQPGHGSGAAFF